MRSYDNGRWGLPVLWGLRASVFPRALALALPNGILAFFLGMAIEATDGDRELTKNAFSIMASFSSVLFFVLYFRSNVAYGRWWEGGTLLQQTRGEWFNAYSSLIAFTTPDPELEAEVEAYQHMLARLMSLLFCSALQQVSPNRNRAFEIIDTTGIDPQSLHFLSESTDRVEVILQWVQRSTILNMRSGILPIPPPVMSRAFQEISRGIVNLQNARKIADFPFPFPYAQASVVMLIIHWAMCPITACMLLNHFGAALASFCIVFFLWCIHFIALELESPFVSDDNDLPMHQMQADWNNSIATLLAKRANHPPSFSFDGDAHRKLDISMSDGTHIAPRQLVMAGYVNGVEDTCHKDEPCKVPEPPVLINGFGGAGHSNIPDVSPTALAIDGSGTSDGGDASSGGVQSDSGAADADADVSTSAAGGSGGSPVALAASRSQKVSASQAMSATLSSSPRGSTMRHGSSPRSSLRAAAEGGAGVTIAPSVTPSSSGSAGAHGRTSNRALLLPTGCTAGATCFSPFPRANTTRSLPISPCPPGQSSSASLATPVRLRLNE